MSEKSSCACEHAPIDAANDKAAAPHNLAKNESTGGQDTQSLALKIQNMDCPTEEKLIRLSLKTVAGIAALDFDLLNRILTVHHTLSNTDIIFSKLKEIGMSALPLPATTTASATTQTQTPSVSRRQIITMSIAAVAAFSSEFLAWRGAANDSLPVIMTALIAVFAGGIPTLKKAWVALRHLSLNIYLLMATAVIGAVAIGQWPEAAVVIVLFGIAELIEAASLDRARNAIAGLMAHAPETANTLQTNGEWKDSPVNEITLDQMIRVRAGERIALDGIVASGHSSVDQAAITGESMPVEKRTGDQVYAGTLNQSGTLQLRVSSLQADTMLSRIARSVQQAQSQRAPTQSLVDQFAAYYTPVVFVVALLIAVLPPLLGTNSWHDSLYQALVLLVIACPCALVISTPVTVVCGLALAAKRGILIKGGLYLEQGKNLRLIALDKTGTLTEGKPSLTDVIALAHLSQAEILQIAASLEAGSQHPVAYAILSRHAESGENLMPVLHFSSITASGVNGEINGQRYSLGNLRMFESLNLTLAPEVKKILDENLAQLEQQNKTVLILADTRHVLALLAVADKLRVSSQTAVRELQTMGIDLVMLTGDNAQTAKAIAAQVGISEVRSQLLPEEKLLAITQFSDKQITGMVGDGVNDAPALARAHIGFAMGAAGSDTALETADVALMQDDLRKLPEFIRISKQTARVLWQNIGFAISVKILFFALTLTGHSSMWMAVFADTGTSLLVVLNGLRLLRYQVSSVSETSSS
ncbi:heavy metal translocating P-type ATPase [Undibacterium parvum]|uniref:Heavy metal translocating P-type ATPase n=1 Tax=Undibacterium parvum TaxID=401471 RepID=A0A3S9HLN2_9BURK|nr:heavy metal translocating P-type ATPase [Undibacterium parvum]AZP13022.1 heavy metal translocating P-type ATPase [Undibacterium parvum]